MTKLLTKMAVATTAVALLTTAATAQGWGRGRGMCMGGRWATVSTEDQQKVADVHQRVREAQWELWTLKAEDADQKQIEKKTNEVLKLRAEMAKLKTNLAPGPGYQLTQGGTATPPVAAGPGMGFGRGRGMRGGGMGYGRGGGWGGAGMCWRLQTPTPPAATQ